MDHGLSFDHFLDPVTFAQETNIPVFVGNSLSWMLGLPQHLSNHPVLHPYQFLVAFSNLELMRTAQPCGPLHSFRREDQCFGWSCGSMAQCLHLSSGRESGWMAFFDVWCWANPVHQIYPNIVPFPAECRQM